MDTATVLFTDLVDSTVTRARLGDDAADELRRRHDQLLAECVAEHNGSVVKGLGDGIMATFSSAADGVAAAVDMQRAIATHNTRQPQQAMAVRIGVSSGDVVREEGDCFGRPVIEASRLCTAADGGQILVADVVRMLARQRDGFGFNPVGELELKGLADAVAASEVTWEPLPDAIRAEPLPIPDLLESGARLDFSGRDDELDAVVMAWKQALTGERQAVLLAGEPGIGKTRLARELALRAHEQGGSVLYGRCEEDLGAPYQPFVEALEYFVRNSDPAVLRASLGRYPGELTRLCPSVADVVPDLPPPIRSDAETERYRLFEAVASWLTTACEPHGIVLVLDDLHWATRPTLVLLQHLLHASTSSRLLVTGTYRDTDLDRTHPLSGLLADLRRVDGVRRIPLSGLERDGVVRLVAHAAGHELDDEGRSLAGMIHAETEGNPFFVGEILRHLRETGAIYLEGGRWVSQIKAAEVGIPEGVREVVGRRLDRLSQEANRALSTASVIGRDFDLNTVSGVAGLDTDTVINALDEAVDARLIEETAAGSYRFAHALVRSTLYDELSATRRSRAHHKVAEFVERERPGDVASLAHHYGQSAGTADVEKAVRYAKLAGDQAMNQLAHDSALVWYRHALELLEDAADATDQQRCELLVAVGDAQRRCGDPAHRRTLLDAGALAHRIGATNLLAQACLLNSRGFWSIAGDIDEERIDLLETALADIGDEDSADRARLLALLAVELMFSPLHERRHLLMGEAITVARKTGDVRALADVLTNGGAVNFVPWAMDVSRECAEELLTLAADIADPQLWALANLWGFVTAGGTGDIDVADERLAEFRRVEAELGQPTIHWLAIAWTAYRVQLGGDIDEAERLATEAYELGERTGQPDALTWYSAQVFHISRERGQAEGLIDMVRDEVERNPGLPAWRLVLGLLSAMQGDKDGAATVLERFAPNGEMTVDRDVLWLYSGAVVLELAEFVGDATTAERLYAELLPFRAYPVHTGVTYQGSTEIYLAAGARAMGRYDDAVGHLEAAVRFEESMKARTWLGVACADLARTLRMRGRDGDEELAASYLERALELARETGSVLVERRAAGQFA